MHAFFVFVGLILGWLSSHASSDPAAATATAEVVMARLAQLRQVALSQPRPTTCNESRLVVITEFAWGNAGNQLISFTHGLWIAELAAATFVVPHYMSAILYPFNLSTVRDAFCFKEEWEYEDAATARLARQHGLSYTHVAPPPSKYRKKAPIFPAGAEVLEIESETCFFLFRFLKELAAGKIANPRFLGYLPARLRDPRRALDSASEAFVRVYAALWSAPIASVMLASLIVVSTKLGDALEYTAVHKRGMEGGCNKVLAHTTSLADYSGLGLPMDREEWSRVSPRFHPLCEMPAPFVLACCRSFYNNASSAASTATAAGAAAGTQCGAGKGLFVAFDGRGDISDYRAAGAVFSQDVDWLASNHSGLVGAPYHTGTIATLDKKCVPCSAQPPAPCPLPPAHCPLPSAPFLLSCRYNYGPFF